MMTLAWRCRVKVGLLVHKLAYVSNRPWSDSGYVQEVRFTNTSIRRTGSWSEQWGTVSGGRLGGLPLILHYNSRTRPFVLKVG